MDKIDKEKLKSIKNIDSLTKEEKQKIVLYAELRCLFHLLDNKVLEKLKSELPNLGLRNYEK